MIAILALLGKFGNLILRVLVVQVPFLVVVLAAVGTWYILEDPWGEKQDVLPPPKPIIIEIPVPGKAYIETLPPVIIDSSKIYYDTTWDSFPFPVLVEGRGRVQGVVEAETTMTVPYPTNRFWVKTKTQFPSGRAKYWFRFDPYVCPEPKEKRWLLAFGAGVDLGEETYQPFLLADLNYRGYGLGATVRESSYGLYFRKTF